MLSSHRLPCLALKHPGARSYALLDQPFEPPSLALKDNLEDVLQNELGSHTGLALLSTALLLQHEDAEVRFCFAATCIRLQALRNASCLEHVDADANDGPNLVMRKEQIGKERKGD